MAGFDMSKYREMFADEAAEIFDDIDSLLLEAESEGSLDDEQMNTLFRGVHTLKGSGASVELTQFAGFAHHAENLMDELRNHKIEYHETMAPFLIDCMDILKIMLTLEINNDLDESLHNELIGTKLEDIQLFLDGKLLDKDTPNQPKEDESELTNNDEENLIQQPQEDESDIQEDRIEGFGLFEGEEDEHSNSHLIDNKVQKDEGFEYFNSQTVSRKDSHSDNSTIGFYEENLELKTSSDNSDFGFFDNSLSEAKEKEIKAPKEDSVISDTNIESYNEATEEVTTKNSDDNSYIQPKEELKKDISTSAEKTIIKNNNSDLVKEAASKKVTKSSNNIRVNLDKIDTLMNSVGDLVITNAMLTQFASTIDNKKIQSEIIEKLEHLNRHIRSMQDSIMSIRMVPMESVYSKFPKIIRDLSKTMDKKVDFTHTGDSVEIDKAMIEGLTDPLVHIIRNSLDHGLESSKDRIASGKNEIGSISIGAEQSNGQMIISIKDDGAGINLDKVVNKAIENGTLDENQAKLMSDEDKAMLIFGAGLSTASKVTNVSGRGVGMDVVKTNITKLGGVIKIDTELGVGTSITIVLPLTLAILDGLDIAIGETTYILPLNSIVESIQPSADMIKKVGDGEEELLLLREEFIPIVRLSNLLHIHTDIKKLTEGMLIVVKAGNEKIAIFVDKFLDQQQVVVKPIDKNFKSVAGIGAATVRGDGSIGLILDILGIIDYKKNTYKVDDA
jgi:two-component system, chemotaxis family, sensor kinase CheA